jgi:zinc-binding alcohol dehydrogenase family protein
MKATRPGPVRFPPTCCTLMTCNGRSPATCWCGSTRPRSTPATGTSCAATHTSPACPPSWDGARRRSGPRARTSRAEGTLILSGGGVSRGGSLVGPLGLMVRGMALSRFVRHRIVLLTARQSQDNLATLRELAESGTITPIIDRTYPLAQAPDAIRYLETEHARAKVTITV